MIPGKKYDPGTDTSKRPTPETFSHLKKFTAPIVRDIKITSIEQMTNINQQLEQSAELYVSNIISRVIAQLIGKYGDGFVTLEATEDGKLKVSTAEYGGNAIDLQADADGNLIVSTIADSKTHFSVKVDFADGVDEVIVAAVAGVTLNITNMMLTVGGETNLDFADGVGDLTGPMDFGGTDEPRAFVFTAGQDPWKITVGRAFVIGSSEVVQISGFVSGFLTT